MKTIITAVLGLAFATPAVRAGFSASEVRFWVGSGDNEAVLVVDWNTQPGVGPEPVSLAWGYRWDGVATGADMISAVLAADPNLYARVANFTFGDIIVGLGYDLDADGFGLSDGTIFGSDGIANAGTSDGATATDPDDHYAEGWNTGFWSYWVGQGAPFDGGAWAQAGAGFGDRTLADGDWDGWRFAPGFVSETPREPVAAVPGPGVAVAGVIGLLLAPRRRR